MLIAMRKSVLGDQSVSLAETPWAALVQSSSPGSTPDRYPLRSRRLSVLSDSLRRNRLIENSRDFAGALFLGVASTSQYFCNAGQGRRIVDGRRDFIVAPIGNFLHRAPQDLPRPRLGQSCDDHRGPERRHRSDPPPKPFDFLTWFEYAPEHAEDFEQLVRELRKTEEWDFVQREVDVRLTL